MEGDAAFKSSKKEPMLELNNYFLLQLPAIDDMIRIINESNIFVCLQIPRLTLENIKDAERTCAYDEISTMIDKLPKDWIGSDEFGNRKSKTDLIRCVWGQHKEAESVLGFQVAILQKYPPRSRSITQFNTLITSNAYYDGVTWKKAVKNFIFKEVLTLYVSKDDDEEAKRKKTLQAERERAALLFEKKCKTKNIEKNQHLKEKKKNKNKKRKRF
jgi:hypothetical protein